MQRQWTGKNVDLDLLSECVEGFFKDRGFITKRNESAQERTVLCVPRRATRIKGTMTAKIVGDSNDCVIELIANESARRSVWLGMLTKSLGGGYFVLRSLRSREALEELEREFWVFTEDKVAHLAGSAGTP